jgi:transcriptional regulator NrdR family protein
MEITVTKRNGSKERFDQSKIACVVKAAGLSDEEATSLSEKVADEILKLGDKEITSIQIRDKVIEELKKVNEAAYDLYVWYEKTKDHPQ